MKILTILIFHFFLSLLLFGQSKNERQMTERINNIRNSTGRIIIDSIAKGTGFIISEDGKIVTCWHVIDIPFKFYKNGKISNHIYFENNEKKWIELFIPDSFAKINEYGYLYDYIVLQTKDSKIKYPYLKIGDFNKCHLGSEIYTCGYSFAQSLSIFAQGIISNILVDTAFFYNDTIIKKSAILDITLNRGNSGGAIILKGKKPKYDRVIGIADFIIIPEQVEKMGKLKEHMNLREMGGWESGDINSADLYKSFIETFEQTSYGIGGIISINIIKEKLKY